MRSCARLAACTSVVKLFVAGGCAALTINATPALASPQAVLEDAVELCLRYLETGDDFTDVANWEMYDLDGGDFGFAFHQDYQIYVSFYAASGQLPGDGYRSCNIMDPGFPVEMLVALDGLHNEATFVDKWRETTLPLVSFELHEILATALKNRFLGDPDYVQIVMDEPSFYSNEFVRCRPRTLRRVEQMTYWDGPDGGARRDVLFIGLSLTQHTWNIPSPEQLHRCANL